jgi:Na+-driven multidrug efflux pump
MLGVSWLLVPLVYGPAYRATVPPLLILLPGVMAMGVFKVLTRDFSSRNRQQVSILASGVALVLNMGLDLLLIRRWGVTGAATASTVGYTAAGAVLLAFFLRDSKLDWREVLLPRWDELIGHWHWAKASLQNQRQKARIKASQT